MRQCDVGTPGARAIAAAWRWKQLVSLNLGENRIGTSGAGALAESAVLVRLLSLSLDQNQVGTDGIEALERSPRIASFGYQRPA